MQNTSHAVTTQPIPHSSVDDFPTPRWSERALARQIVGAPEASVASVRGSAPSLRDAPSEGGLMRTRADLTELPGFSALAVDTTGNPCVWRNLHACDCLDGPQSVWESDWSCQCDDECPGCGVSCSPYDSIWLGPADDELRALWETLPEAGGESSGRPMAAARSSCAQTSGGGAL